MYFVLSTFQVRKMFLPYIALLLSFGNFAYGVFEGENCVKDGVAGICKNINQCPPAQEDFKNRITPQLCSFAGIDPVVCCVTRAPSTTTKGPAATTSTARTTTTEYIPPVYDYVSNEDRVGGCEALSSSMTARTSGRKAWDKCIQYQEQLVFPCQKSSALSGDLGRANNCHHNSDELIIGGENAAANEFPHMALLGYGATSETAEWLCGGSIISERFILTAGHCTFHRIAGDVTFAAVGRLTRSEKWDNNKVYKISRIVKHPEYKPPIKYNDIAVLETEREIQLDQFVVPACIDIGSKAKRDRVIATGWGLTEYGGSSADVLQKVKLTQFTDGECSAKFPVSRLMKQGYDLNTQVCYGDYNKSRDSCQGDSGGPVQIYNTDIFCMYTLVGITSFGKACGFVGLPGIYTRVAPYAAWIESVVWP